MTGDPPLTIAVMAKPAVPGKVKTRLAARVGPTSAARIHRAMLECTLARIAGLFEDADLVLCLAVDLTLAPEAWPRDQPDLPARWSIFDQGTGSLGDRIGRAWRAFGRGSVVFLGSDSPDVPRGTLAAIRPAMDRSDLVLGPAKDGGYWTLAARRPLTEVLEAVDWGTSRVYHQTEVAARRGGLTVGRLTTWTDVDTLEDVQTLRARLAESTEPALQSLQGTLSRILD